jgi:hypothetical protein
VADSRASRRRRWSPTTSSHGQRDGVRRDVEAFPGLNTLGVSSNRVDLAPGGVNPLHSHPSWCTWWRARCSSASSARRGGSTTRWCGRARASSSRAASCTSSTTSGHDRVQQPAARRRARALRGRAGDTRRRPGKELPGGRRDHQAPQVQEPERIAWPWWSLPSAYANRFWGQ